MFRTHYHNLQISPDADPKAIRLAYKRLAQKWHPDKNSHRIDEAEKHMTLINEAYRVLSSPELRRKHNRWIEKRQADQRSVGPTEHPRETRQTTTHTGNRTSGHSRSNSDIRRRYTHSGARHRTKKSSNTYNPYRVSKHNFRLLILGLICLPAALAVVGKYGDKLSEHMLYSIRNLFNESTPTVGPDPIETTLRSGDAEITGSLTELLSTISVQLSNVKNADQAIAVSSALIETRKLVEELSVRLERLDDSAQSSASAAVKFGFGRMKAEVVRLQSNPDVWAILYPTLQPMMNTLRRIAR